MASALWHAVTPEPQYTMGSLSSPTTGANRARSTSAGRNRPSLSRLSVNSRLIAPGTWPAAASIGSSSPAYRAGSRLSMTTPPSAMWRCDVDRVGERLERPVDHRSLGGLPAHRLDVDALAGGLHAVRSRRRAGPRRWPSIRSIHTSRPAKAPPRSSYATTVASGPIPSSASDAAKSSGAGSG